MLGMLTYRCVGSQTTQKPPATPRSPPRDPAADRAQLIRGWQSEVELEMKACRGDKIAATYAARRKHPGLWAAFIEAIN